MLRCDYRWCVSLLHCDYNMYHCYVVIITDGGVPPGTHAVQDADYVCPPVLQRRDPDGGLHVVRTECVLPTKGLCHINLCRYVSQWCKYNWWLYEQNVFYRPKVCVACGSGDKYFNYRGDNIVLIVTECLLQTTSMCEALCCKRFFCSFLSWYFSLPFRF